MSRLVLGVFQPTRQGGWEGELRTLTMAAKLRFVPNDDRGSVNAPAFRAMVGAARVGDAWEARWGADRSRTYYRVILDDPTFSAPLSAALFPDEGEDSAQLVWTRPEKEEAASHDDPGLSDRQGRAGTNRH